MTRAACEENITKFENNIKQHSFFKDDDRFNLFINDFFDEIRKLNMEKIAGFRMNSLLLKLFPSEGIVFSNFRDNIDDLFIFELGGELSKFASFEEHSTEDILNYLSTNEYLEASWKEQYEYNVPIIENLQQIALEYKESPYLNPVKSARF